LPNTRKARDARAAISYTYIMKYIKCHEFLLKLLRKLDFKIYRNDNCMTYESCPNHNNINEIRRCE